MVLFFGVYFGYQLKLYFSPPNLIILAPQKTTFVIENNIKVVGKTDKEAAVTIFGERVYQDKNGVFVYNFPLKIGTNELVIEIVGANGKKNTIKKIYIKSNQY